ncbi:hypothetical protein [Pseudoclavibacter sp. JSM 162008]|uniref:hypothetical protein n=1 Tax=Pseudoclavibacter sp. JSM 162008 TaxID=3229855 RepID=UPI00352459A0
MISTDAGLCAMWVPHRFDHVKTIDDWQQLFDSDDEIAKFIEQGSLIPINVGAARSFEITIRSSAPTARETLLTIVQSEPYRLVSTGTLEVGGIEQIGPFGGGGIRAEIDPGTLSVKVNLVDWRDEVPTSDIALSDFVVEITPALHREVFRTKVNTFDPPEDDL